ncbi:phytoene/squalene synthase family protein [Nocardia sp. CDC159]|uniref:Phytoene/squalene synthase family protein n=1 Tax=Nocardia pulmonis TaxID=2951408 RepID=A0A9X2IWW8_9NOCA|nr:MULTISPECIES: phytoene/squalene synthase family protein [Nocardia]MCM6775387.1 phytoene/squalene synthase family protein [Nocardia pulmonis]MCM6787879.1 phytoene/squalene synthase family protein [Nocardia sp. CDC159]
MTRRELDAAGITDPPLRQAYSRCRELNAAHGRTYFLATRLLPPDRRPAVHALYGFARYVDDLVDLPETEATPETVRARIATAEGQLADGLARGDSDVPVVAAAVHTARRYGIDPALFSAFLASMRMDLEIRDYPTRTELRRYTYGSAQVIGLQLLPVLGTVTDPAEAAPYAAALGDAFQLTNFLRDIAEDLDRGRIYLPADELAVFGVDRERLTHCRAHGRADAAVRAAIADQIARTRAVYATAAAGVELLSPWSRPCVATAFTLYSGILDRIAAMDHDVFAARATVGAGRKLRVAVPALARAWWIRRHVPSATGQLTG